MSRLLMRSTAICALGVLLAAGVSAQPGGGPFVAWVEAIKGGEDPLRWPVAVVAIADTELAVADVFGNRVIVFEDLGGGSGWKQKAAVTLPSAPHSLEFEGGRLLVSLRGEGGLVALEGPDLQQRRLPMPSGVVPGDLSAGPDALLVHDLATGSVLAIDAGGESLSSVAVEGTVTALVAGNDGGFRVTVAEPPSVQRFDAAGQLIDSWPVPGLSPETAWPSGLIVDKGGQSIVADQHGGRLVLLDGNGGLDGLGSRRGWEPGLLRYPADLGLLPDGRIAVADRANGRIQIFRRLEDGSGL